MAEKQHKSHGCGRRMALNGPKEAVSEAIERRAMIIRAHGSIVNSWDHAEDRNPGNTNTMVEQDRRWAYWTCHRPGGCIGSFPRGVAPEAEDVGLIDGVPVAMCAECREETAP